MGGRPTAGDYMQAIINLFWAVGTIFGMVAMYMFSGGIGSYMVYAAVKFMVTNPWGVRYACALGTLVFGLSLVFYWAKGLPAMLRFLISSVRMLFGLDR